jgi:hypothetical protein
VSDAASVFSAEVAEVLKSEAPLRIPEDTLNVEESCLLGYNAL